MAALVGPKAPPPRWGCSAPPYKPRCANWASKARKPEAPIRAATVSEGAKAPTPIGHLESGGERLVCTRPPGRALTPLVDAPLNAPNAAPSRASHQAVFRLAVFPRGRSTSRLGQTMTAARKTTA